MMIAAWHGDAPLMDLLLDHDAESATKDKVGRTWQTTLSCLVCRIAPTALMTTCQYNERNTHALQGALSHCE